MIAEMWVAILLAWTIAGLFVAIVFGRMNRDGDKIFKGIQD
jgi:hypothetical protein